MIDERPARPEPLPFVRESIPDTLAERGQWVAWRYYFDTDRNKWTKMPIDVTTGRFAKSTDPETWTSFDDALEYHRRDDTDTDGLGFVVSDDDLFVGIDLDDVRDPETGDLEAWVNDMVEAIPTYAEVSPSGTGVRLFGLGFVPDGGNRADVDDADGHLEMYDTGRYLTVTGHKIDGSPDDVEQVNNAVSQVHAQYIADDESDYSSAKTDDDCGAEGRSSGLNPGSDGRETGSHDLTDEQIVQKAMNAENGDKFTRLWRGDSSGYSSHSEADCALVSLLAFWSGGNRQQIDRLFRQSGLYREKWEREDYREATISRVLDGRTEFYEPSAAIECPSEPVDAADAWRLASELFADDETPTGEAIQRAADAITVDFDLLTVEDDNTMRRFDAEHGVFVDDADARVHERLANRLGSQFSTHRHREVCSTLQARTYVRQDTLDADPWQLPAANGVVDLHPLEDGPTDVADLEYRPARPSDRLIRTIAAPFDPAAECPAWLDFLDSVTGSDRDQRLLQEFVGYALYHWGFPYQKAVFLTGPTDSGKSTFINTVLDLLGPDMTTKATLQQLTNTRFHSYRLEDTWVNAANDIPTDIVESSGTFKSLTGDDKHTVEAKGRDPYDIEPQAKLLFSANQLPEVQDADDAFFNRVILVEFPTTIPPEDQDTRLGAKLADEHAGILNWALDGLGDLLYRDAFGDDDPETTRSRWRFQGSLLDRFISGALEPDHGSRTAVSDVYDAYVEACEDVGETPTATKKALTTRVIGAYDSVERGNHSPIGRHYVNLRLLPKDEWFGGLS
ncbi:phage/plasmid primase, P4 family [Halostagnicola sp. A56]|uniref:phage/plasmid primase, P4 family n=1 Tax=Halostagnicola sp. A56 TaxID=1495067 RepID=UPI00049FEDED|nr:phage/plasmid primase, P4 family [Halostagnicola sp. A56]